MTECSENYKEKGIFIPFNCNRPFSFKIEDYNDSIPFYFPKNLFYDSITQKNIDSRWFDEWEEISYALLKMNEPILCECYHSCETYRLYLGETFYPSTTITINKDADSIWVDFKSLDRVIEFPFLISEDIFDDKFDKVAHRQTHDDSIHNNPNYIIATFIHKKLSEKEWNSFTEILDINRFWQLPSYHKVVDYRSGTEWIMEGHCKSGYKYLEYESSTFLKYLNYFIDIGIVDQRLIKVFKKYKILQLTNR